MTAPKNPKPIGLPITVSAAQALANLQVSEQMDAKRAAKRSATKVSMHALKPAQGTPFGRAAAGPTNKADRDAAAVHASYMVGDTTPSQVNLSVKDMPGPMLLEVTAIDCYDHNPRVFANDKIDDIEASIRANGCHDALVVTRRREGERFMLAAGSNTTLRVLQELWQSTQDEKFRWVNCIFQPFENDTRLLAQHLGENLNRGDMKFWEVAQGMVALLAQLGAESRHEGGDNRGMGLREQAEALVARGLRANKSQVALWRFAVVHLGALGPALPHLTVRAVLDHLQPRTHALRNLAARFKIAEPAFWDETVDPALKRYGQACGQTMGHADAAPFDAAALCDLVEVAFADQVGESVASVRQMLSLLRLSPLLTLADLRMPSPSMVVGRMTSSAGPTDAEPAAAHASTRSQDAQQPQLPSGPAQLRGNGVNPRSLRPALPARPAPAVQELPSAAGLLFSDEHDPLKTLHRAVVALLAAAGLEDTLRWRDEMPMGFFIDLPDPALHVRQPGMQGSPAFQTRTVKTVVWWSLVLMTGQFRNSVVPYIDQDSAFFRMFAADGLGNSSLLGTDIEASAPEMDDMLMHRLAPGRMQEVLRHLRTVEDAAATMFAHSPDRWRRMLEVASR